MDSITFSGLENWYVRLFEKVGWLILSYDENNEENESNKKINDHLYKLRKWLELAKKKLNSKNVSKSQVEDINIMVNNIYKLLNFFEKKFKFIDSNLKEIIIDNEENNMVNLANVV